MSVLGRFVPNLFIRFEFTGARCRNDALQDAQFRAKRLPFCETCCLNIQETALDLLVETNPTGYVEANGFFSRFLLVQQKVQKRMANRKSVTISEAAPAAVASSPSPAAKLSPSTHLLSATHTTHTHAEAMEESGLAAAASGSPSSPTAKLMQMQHRKEPSWSLLTQPGANQVKSRVNLLPPRNCGCARQLLMVT